MIYALVHYPNVDVGPIDRLRMKYDPQFNLIRSHITILFPLSEAVDGHEIVTWVEGVFRRWKPFPIRLSGLEKSGDGYLFLLVQEGRAEVVRLQDELYAGMLAQYRRSDVPFVPHVTLGAFGSDAIECSRALEEAGRLNLDYVSLLDQAHLVKIDEARTRIISSEVFLLG